MRLFVLALPLVLMGCTPARDAEGRATRRAIVPNKIEISKPSSPTQRFLPTNTGDLAFDTQEGVLCKTWYWDADKHTEPGSHEGQPHFSAPVCSAEYEGDRDHEHQMEYDSLRRQQETWAHEEKMKGVK